jgi:hypothetical protein
MAATILEREYTIEEVAEMLDLRPGAVRRRILGTYSGPRLEARKEGKEYRVPESKLRKYVASTYLQSA